MLISIVMGPAMIIQVGGRTPVVLWADLMVVAMAAYAALRFAPRLMNEVRRLPWIFWMYFAYLVVATVYLALSRDWLIGLATWKLRVMPPLALFIAYTSVRDAESARRIGWAFGLTGGVTAVLTIANFVTISRGGAGAFNNAVVTSKDMAQTSFGTSNYLASILIFCLPWCIVTWSRSRLWASVLSISSAGIILWALLLTQSRGALISVVAGVLLFLMELVLAHKIRLRTVLSVLGVIAFTIVTAYWIWSMAPYSVASELAKRTDLLISDFSAHNWANNRTEVWMPAVDYIAAHPVIGLGLGNQALAGDLLGRVDTAHNVLLEAWLELGALGFLLLFGFLYRGWKTWHSVAFGQRRWGIGLGLAGVLSFEVSILHCMVEPSFWGVQFAYLFWMALGVGLALLRLQNEAARTLVIRVPSTWTSR
jgi:O-antigen ligase